MTAPSPIRTAWASAHRAVAVTWILGTGLVLGGIWLLGELASHGGTPFGAISGPAPGRLRDAATIAFASGLIAHAALLPGSWIGRRGAAAAKQEADADGETGQRTPESRSGPDRQTGPERRSDPPRQSGPARQSVAGGGDNDPVRNDVIPEKKGADGQDGVVAWFAGTLVRLFGTVALVGCYRYQLAESGDPGFFLASIVGWYLVLTFVEVWVLAKALPAQDRPFS